MTPTWLPRFLAVSSLLVGVAFVALGVVGWLRVEGLSSRAEVTSARVTEVRARGDSDTGIVATYEFEVGGQRYHRVGIFGTEVSADITPEQAADPAGVIPVRYLPDDPWVNEPVSAVTPGATRQLVAIGLGLALMVVGVLRWFAARGG